MDNNHMPRHVIKNMPGIRAYRVGVILLAVWLMVSGCRSEVNDASVPEPPGKPFVEVSGYTIPLFAKAAAQLDYARSLFADAMEKKATLDLVISRFPKDRQEQAEARLELAYLLLGPDFRLADQNTCESALRAYESIAREFADLPAIRAKANWYLGWIYTDLLHDESKGLAAYSQLAKKYPRDRFSRISPVPWLKLVFPDPGEKPYTADDEHTHSWAGLALLEIVRHANDVSDRLQAFDILWHEHRNSMTTGYALKTILNSSLATPSMSRIVDEYVSSNSVNPALNQDLRAALARWPSDERQPQP
jgi:hypothetical protein